jgi:hypothetical protein
MERLQNRSMVSIRPLLVSIFLARSLNVAHSVGVAQAAFHPFNSLSECQLRGTSVFHPPLSLKNRQTNVAFMGTLSGCPKNSYGITGGTIKTSGSGMATCSSNYSDTQTATGTITWKGVKGTSTYSSTSTAIGNSKPPATWVSGTMTGGAPLPVGTTSGGETTFAMTPALKRACDAGTLKKLSVSGTSAPTLSACTLIGTSRFNPPLSLTNQQTTVTFSGTISSCAKNPDDIIGGTVSLTGAGLDSCNPNITDIVKSNGTIVWNGKIGTNTFESTTTTLVNSSPTAILVTGSITGGSPLPTGTPTGGGVQSAPTSDTIANECIAGILKSIAVDSSTTS